MCVRGWAPGKMEALLVQAPSDPQQNRVLRLCLTPHPLPPCLSSLPPSPLPSLSPSPLLAPILKQYDTHIPVDIGMERDVGRNTKVKETVNSFKELRASWGSRTCEHAPCRQDRGGVLQGREQRREHAAPQWGVRGRRGHTAKHRAFPKPSTAQILCRRPS